MSAGRIGVVLNPNALGVRRRPGMRERLQQILGHRGEVIETRTPEDLAAAARHFAEGGVHVVGTCGGDGTNLSTVTEMVRAYGVDHLPTFAILRGGTVNTIAENLAIRGKPEEILGRLVARADAGEVPTRGQDLLVVNKMYGFLFAAAMGARFLEAYYGGPLPGPAWAAVLAARTVASSLVTGAFARWLFAPVEMALEIDGRAVTDFVAPRLFLASTVPDVGIGMKVTWQAGKQPGRFHLIASNLSTVAMGLQLHRVLAGQPLAGSPHLDTLAAHARIRFAEPQTFTLDGELFRERDVDIAVGPRLWIARP
ncbi:MAG TPA: diacylglycerol kinase family protein [Kofleriaceae bacterium]|nr:diacylglycerol kinase family protein [Kofleriaceae bacterium]